MTEIKSIKAEPKVKSFRDLKREMGQIAWDETPDSVIYAVFELLDSFETGLRNFDDEELQHLDKRELLRRVLDGEGG